MPPSVKGFVTTPDKLGMLKTLEISSLPMKNTEREMSTIVLIQIGGRLQVMVGTITCNNVGVIGLGSVGEAAFSTFSEHFHTVGFDIDGGDWNEILASDVVLFAFLLMELQINNWMSLE